jgi:hypothetical protein
LNSRILAISLIALILGAPAGAANWRVSSRGGGAVSFTDLDSIIRVGEKVTFTHEIRWGAARTLADGSRFDRLAALIEGNCRAMTLQKFHLRASMGAQVISEVWEVGKIEPAGRGTTGEADLRAVCFDEWPD